MNRIQEPVLITSFGEVELCNAFQLRVFRNTLKAHEAQAANAAFARDVLNGVFDLRPFAPAILELAKRLSVKHTATLSTRALDLMHVASAVHLQASVFLSFDLNQRKLAQAAGLTLQPRTLSHLSKNS